MSSSNLNFGIKLTGLPASPVAEEEKWTRNLTAVLKG